MITSLLVATALATFGLGVSVVCVYDNFSEPAQCGLTARHGCGGARRLRFTLLPPLQHSLPLLPRLIASGR